MQIFSLGAGDEFTIGNDVRGKILEVGEDYIDLELQSCDDGDTRVVRLWTATNDAEATRQQPELELAGAV